MISVLRIIEDTMVDGPGFRTSIYCAGCRHQCAGCHNPQSWDFEGGQAMTTDEIMSVIEDDPYANVTFSGGDPMYQPEGFAELAQAIKTRTDKDIWCYTGFTYESLVSNPRQKALLEKIDVLVDGPFVKSQRDETLHFRGSRNQRLIDVPASLREGKVCLYKE
ncbi:anaerobic ribonucleoside-triphosphate reductase activating protein [Prevotella sp. E13-17]|uniref:anaerobic ribonucleoside-triphosphate reductase activating protein n=1 Tax=Prevotella sp. E13-17 TaxID=2913616 RepID=UPI001EDAE75B|nr:anaerobic ribonucleoside-triphosphate reductase activating protein [Prevotella sp. E13-17]UKK50740.1 anaerobic ribonucleoside-triphosphate reductase activating protein [Prevotella sp. E13-17]